METNYFDKSLFVDPSTLSTELMDKFYEACEYAYQITHETNCTKEIIEVDGYYAVVCVSLSSKQVCTHVNNDINGDIYCIPFDAEKVYPLQIAQRVFRFKR